MTAAAACAAPSGQFEPASGDDALLLADVAAGDEAALAYLYDRYAIVAYGLALRVTRDRRLAEDAVQEAFLEVWRGASSYDGRRGSPRSWILACVHHRAVDVVRREERRRRADVLVLTGTAASAEDEAELRAERVRVRAALARLPLDQRRVLELAYYGGRTQSQAAAELGVALGTVKSRTFAGLDTLRNLLS